MKNNDIKKWWLTINAERFGGGEPEIIIKAKEVIKKDEKTIIADGIEVSFSDDIEDDPQICTMPSRSHTLAAYNITDDFPMTATCQKIIDKK